MARLKMALTVTNFVTMCQCVVESEQ